jgi:hypothetical protein
MKKVYGILAGASLLLVIGCSDYDIRMNETFAEMKYQKRLNDNLADAPTKGTLQQDAIYVRPPKGLVLAQAFTLAPVETGNFDIENSFVDQEKQASLHLLARIKKPKAPPGAKKAAIASEPPARGKFVDDVLEIIKTAYNVELPASSLKAEVKGHANRNNTFKATKLDQETKETQIYMYGDANSAYEVALIFEYPKKELSYMAPKIGLCLESFAVGDRANRAFSGTGDLDTGEEAGGGAPPPI